MEYLLHIATLLGLYVILVMSLDLVVGQAGMLSVSHAAFCGIGAYATGLLAVYTQIPFPLNLGLAMTCSAAVSLVISLVAVRLHQDYFVIATFGFQVIILAALNNWTELTHGPLGLGGIPRPNLCGLVIQSNQAWAVIVVLAAILCFVASHRIAASPLGRILNAIREDEVFARAMGKDTRRAKLVVFAVSAAMAALAGGLLAQYLTYIAPASFTVKESIVIVSMVIIGGAGSSWGPLIGAALMVGLPEMMRFLGLPSSVAANGRQILYGLALLLVLFIRPRGLMGGYSFNR